MIMKTLFLLVVLLLCASPVHGEDTVYRISEAVAVIGHMADATSSMHCIGSGRCKEMNPYLARFEQPIPFALAKASVATVGIWAASKIPNKTLGAFVNFGVGSGFLILAIHNTRVGSK